jgi:hypothetical protein
MIISVLRRVCREFYNEMWKFFVLMVLIKVTARKVNNSNTNNNNQSSPSLESYWISTTCQSTTVTNLIQTTSPASTTAIRRIHHCYHASNHNKSRHHNFIGTTTTKTVTWVSFYRIHYSNQKSVCNEWQNDPEGFQHGSPCLFQWWFVAIVVKMTNNMSVSIFLQSPIDHHIDRWPKKMCLLQW